MRRLRLGTFALVIFICFVNSEECSLQCQEMKGIRDLQYQDGVTYIYNFQSSIHIKAPHEKKQASKTRLKATALITPQNECNYMLELRNLEIIGDKSHIYRNLAHIEKPLVFQYQRGVIGSNLCTDVDDSVVSLNIKRAVVSLLQVDSQSERQTDIFGKCSTVSTHEIQPDGSTVIRKTRDLNKCANYRENFVITALKNVKPSNILSSTYDSIQTIKYGILHKASVSERYNYFASSSKQDGIKVSISTTLEYNGRSNFEKSTFQPNQIRTILFENPPPATSARSTVQTILATLKSLTANNLAVDENSANNFLSLIKIIRNSNKDDLTMAYRYVSSDNDDIRKIFLQALIKSGCSNALTLVFDLAQNNELSVSEKRSTYLNLVNVKYVSLDVLNVISALLNNNELPHEAYLNVGNLVRRYCDQNVCNDAVINKIMTSFARKLNILKESEESVLIYTLKAIANSKNLNEDISRRVLHIAESTQTTRVRATALNTLLADSCRDINRNGLLRILQNTEEDSEIRIKAYLVLANCPDHNTAKAIETLINNEPSYQVGSFVSSHLKSSTGILRSINVNKQFPDDPRKYSFNAQLPYRLRDVGVDTKTMGNVIFSANSFIPRSVSVNTTINLFGSDMNLIDIDVRQENLDRLAEYYFGPKGVAVKETDMLDLAPWPMRRRRDVSKTEIESFTKELRENTTTNLNVDIDVKILDADSLYFNIGDDGIIPNVIDYLNMFKRNLQEEFNIFPNKKINSVLIDSQLNYPTSSGFPLRLAVEAVSSSQLQVDKQKSTSNANHQQIWRFIPSVNVNLATSIILDANITESGVRINTKLYAAVGADLQINNYAFKGNSIKLLFPLQQQKLLISHKIDFHQQEPGQPNTIKPIVNYEGPKMCSQQILDYTGLHICADLIFPKTFANPYLAGNYEIALSLNNSDFGYVELSNYINRNRSAGEDSLELTAKIVSKKKIVKTGLLLQTVLGPKSLARATLVLPKTNSSVELQLVNTNIEKSVSLELKLNGKKVFGRAGLGIHSVPHKTILTPYLHYSIPGQYGQHFPIKTEGSVIVKDEYHNLKFTLENLQLIITPNEMQKPTIYSVNGVFGNKKSNYYSDLMLSNGDLTIKQHGKVTIGPSRIKVNGNIQNNRKPDLNLHVDYEIIGTPMSLDSHLKLVHGSDSKSKHNRLTIKNYLSAEKSEQVIKYPPAKFSIEANHTISDGIYVGAEIKYDRMLYGKKFNLTYGADGHYDLNFKLYDADNKIELAGKRAIYGYLNKLNHTFSINNRLYEFSGDVQTSGEENGFFDLVIDLLLKAPEFDSPFNFKLQKTQYRPMTVMLVFKDDSHRYIDFNGTVVYGRADINLQVKVPYGRDITKIDCYFNHFNTDGNGQLLINSEGLSTKATLNYYWGSNAFDIKAYYFPNLIVSPNSWGVTLDNSRIDSNFIINGAIETNGHKYLQLHFKKTRIEGVHDVYLQILMDNVNICTGTYKRTQVTSDTSFELKYQLRIDSDIFHRDTDMIDISLVNKQVYGTDIHYALNISTDNAFTGICNANILLNISYHRDILTRTVKFQVYTDEEDEGGQITYNAVMTNNLVSHILHANYSNNLHSILINNSYSRNGTPFKYDMDTKLNTPLFECLENLNVKVSSVFHLYENYTTSLKITTDQKRYAYPSRYYELQLKFERLFRNGWITYAQKYSNSEPLNVKLDYVFEEKSSELTVNLIATGPDRFLATSKVLVQYSINDVLIKANLQYPVYQALIDIHLEKLPTGYYGNGNINLNGKHIKLKSEINFDNSPKFNLEITYPDRVKYQETVTDQILLDFLFGKNDYKGKLMVLLNIWEFSLNTDLNMNNQDGFDLSIDMNFPTIDLYNGKAMISCKELDLTHFSTYTSYSSQNYVKGNELKFSLSNAAENIISGSYVFSITIGNRVTYNHTLNTKIKKNHSQVFNVLYVREPYSKISVYAKTDSVDFNFFINETDIKFYSAVCYENQPCFKIDAFHKEHIVFGRKYEEFLYTDLRYFDLYEVNVTEVLTVAMGGVNLSGNVIFDRKNKYGHELVLYNTFGNLTIYTPADSISIDGHAIYNRLNVLEKIQVNYTGREFQKIVYQSSLTGLSNSHIAKNNHNYNYELKFTDRKLSRDILLSYSMSASPSNVEQTMVIDIFKDEKDKIIISQNVYNGPYETTMKYVLKSEGLDFNIGYFESAVITPGASIEYIYNATYQVDKAKYHNALMLKLSPLQFAVGAVIFNNKIFNISGENLGTALVSKIDVIGITPVTARLEMKSINFVNFTIILKENPLDVYQSTVKILKEGNILHLQSQRNTNGHLILFTNLSLSVKENKLLFTYRYDAKNIENYLLHPLERTIDDVTTEYRRNMENAKIERMEADRNITRKISKNLIKPDNMFLLYSFHLVTIIDTIQKERPIHDISMILDRITYTPLRTMQKGMDNFRYFLYVLTNNIVRQIHRIDVAKGFDIFKSTVFQLLNNINHYNDVHEHEIQEFGTLFTVVFEDGVQSLLTLREYLLQFYMGLENSVLFERLNEGPAAPEVFIQNYLRLINELKKLTNSPTLHRFIDLVANYTEKKLRRETVDNVEEVRKIANAFNDVIPLIYNSKEDTDSLNILYALYRLGIIQGDTMTFLLKYNKINKIKKVVVEELKQISFPSKFNGVIAQKHIFTFDGKRVSVQGDCDYLMLHDIVDGNFSIVASFKGNLLNTITYADKYDKITLLNDKVLVNDQDTEMPISERDVNVFKNYEEIRISSKSGLEISCDLKLTVCSVQVSGYYHARLRGLLGNGNNEMFDDFALPNRRIGSGSEFVDSYKLNRQCVTNAVHQNMINGQCNNIFNHFSLRRCANYVNQTEYIAACNEDVSNMQETIVKAYVKNCNNMGAYVKMPDSLVKCKDYDKNVNETFEVNLPGDTADIVIIVDERNFVSTDLQHLVSGFETILNKMHVEDIVFHIISYGGGIHPHHYWNKELLYHKRRDFSTCWTCGNKDMLNEAYKEALLYPFRAHALKTILIFNPSSCTTLSDVQSELPYVFNINVNMVTRQTRIIMPWEHYKMLNPDSCAKYVIQNYGQVLSISSYRDDVNSAVGKIVGALTKSWSSLKCKCRMISAYRAQNICE